MTVDVANPIDSNVTLQPVSTTLTIQPTPFASVVTLNPTESTVTLKPITTTLDIKPLKSDVSLDVEPLLTDVCAKVTLGEVPPTCVRQPFHQHIGFNLFGVELFGIDFAGEFRTMIEPMSGRAAAEPASGSLRIRLDEGDKKWRR